MKKILMIAAAALTVGLYSCNESLGPEYSTYPKVENFTVEPNVYPAKGEEVAKVYPGESIRMTGVFTNTYGKSNVYLYYRTLEAKEEGKDEPKWSDWNTPSMGSFTLVTWEQAPVENMPFSLAIPGQKAGTKVEWRFGFANIYGLGADTGICTFTVDEELVIPNPDEPEL